MKYRQKPDLLQYQQDLANSLGSDVAKSIQLFNAEEKRYANLIELRSQIKSTSDKKKYKMIQEEIEDLCLVLRETRIALTKQLKENPKISHNTDKFQRDKMDLMDLLLRCVQELRDHRTFRSILRKVEEEKSNQLKLSELKSQEKLLRELVFNLQQQIFSEQNTLKNMVQEKRSEIAHIRQEIHLIKSCAAINSNFQRKESQANVAALWRDYQLRQRKVEAQIKELEERLKTEDIVCTETKEFLVRKTASLNDDYNKWEIKFNTDIKEMDDKIKHSSSEYNHLYEKLMLFRDRKDAEDAENQKKGEETRLLEEVNLKYQSSMMRQNLSAKVIQRIWKTYKLHCKTHYPEKKKDDTPSKSNGNKKKKNKN